MKKFNLHIPHNSIRFKLISGVIIVMIPLITLLIYNNFYAIDVIHNQVAESNKNMMSLYMGQIDAGLDNIDSYLNRLLVSDQNLQILQYTTDENQYNIAEYSLSERISKDVTLSKNIDTIFVYPTAKQILVQSYNSGTTDYERSSVSDYLSNLFIRNKDSVEIYNKGWYVEKINEQYYLFRIMKYDDIYVGAWVSMKKLLIPLRLINLGENGASLLVNSDGQVMLSSNKIEDKNIELNKSLENYYLTGTNNQYMVIGEKSSKGDFSLVAVVPNEKILEKLPLLQKIVTYIAITSVLLVPLCLLFVRKNVLIPLNKLLKAMKRIKNGDIDTRINPEKTSVEFLTVNETFNKMMDEIKHLRISVYEERINKQKIELEQLKLQINPHFFMNSLNIIYNLAKMKDFKLIQEMTVCLVNYFRYIFNTNSMLVPIKDELEHIRNYLRIQEMRFPNQFTYKINVPYNLLYIFIPQLMIQTFVENTIKYAFSMESAIELLINIDLIEKESDKYIKIIVKDTGKGFSQEILKVLNSGNMVIDDNGKHIGIWNIKRRLELLYSGGAKIKFYNADSQGAVVEIILPKL
ncbi:histidine kinase [Clostridium sp. SYSU_GA19001]|uniref:sensor histidine kinase n=1 Tax=Clostridium caldaquaticum TaxID=2940653 RepID=UPI002076ED7F|nr:histidine kinase [Clostridium caldaquaticum]